MSQSQNTFKGANECASCGALLRISARLNLHLGNFQVPVAKFIPDKLVNAARHIVQAVVGKSFGHLSLYTLHA